MIWILISLGITYFVWTTWNDNRKAEAFWEALEMERSKRLRDVHTKRKARRAAGAKKAIQKMVMAPVVDLAEYRRARGA